jgi:hypothetical protein
MNLFTSENLSWNLILSDNWCKLLNTIVLTTLKQEKQFKSKIMKGQFMLLISTAVLISLCISARENTVSNKDKAYKQLTESTPENVIKSENNITESGCSVTRKNYKRKEFHPKISGTWKAVEAWIHDANLLGERIFYFTFLPNDSIKIDESERNWHSRGTWNLDLKENNIQWEMPNPDNSFKGRYNIIDGQLILSGKGFVGSEEFICLKLKKL